MLHDQLATDRQTARPVILGTGLTGLAISHALSAAGVGHVLVGARPTATPRLGESLNAEGSLEIVRQFPGQSRFYFRKWQQALFFGGHALSFDFLQFAAGSAHGALLGYPATVPLLHVDRVGFDRAVFETAVADGHCLYLEDQATALDYRPCADRIDGVRLTGGRTIAAAYVFDATNYLCFVGRRLGVRRRVIGAARRVVFAHYRAAGHLEAAPSPPSSYPSARAAAFLRSMARMFGSTGEAATAISAPAELAGEHRESPLPWLQATSLLRLNAGTDPLEGLAWCIPLGDYVSVGVSVDARTTADPGLLLDGVEKAYAARGMDLRRAFPTRSRPLAFPYEHYDHERCYGRNWLLAGPSCCQFWFPSASGVATGLIAARLAPEVLRTPDDTPARYQAYIDGVATSHSGLEWLVRDDPGSVTLEDLRQRSQAMVAGSVRRLSRYLSLQEPPPELAFGEALTRLYESDRRLANPVHIDTAPSEAQATRLFAKACGTGPWTDPPIQVPVLTRPDRLDVPEAILGMVDLLSGKGDPAGLGSLVTPDLRVQIDGFVLDGMAPYRAWLAFLRGARRVRDRELVPGSVSASGDAWVLACQWQESKDGRRRVSPPFALTFRLTDGRVAAIETRRADYTFVVGDFILPRAAFAAVLGRLAANPAPR